MPDAAPKGASFADAIDLDASSGSESEDMPIGQRQWPPSRPSAFGPGQNQHIDVQRIESDSPPPVIIKSNIRTAPRPLPQQPQSSSSSHQQQPIMTTQQRLRAAIQSRIEGQNSPDTTLRISGSQAPLNSSNSQAHRQQRLAPRLPSPTAYLNGRELHHEILCRLVVEIGITPERKPGMTHGERLYATPTAVSISQANTPWLFRLNNARGTMVGKWFSPATTPLQRWVLSHSLKFNLRYINPASIASGSVLLSMTKTYAFLDIQYPRKGRFEIEYKDRLPVSPLNELGIDMPLLLPSQLHQYHFRDLVSILNSLQATITNQGAAPIAPLPSLPTASDPTSSNRFIKAGMEATAGASNAMGLTGTSSSAANSASNASLLAAYGSANFMFANGMPGSWQPPPMAQDLDDDSYLFQMAAMNQSAFDNGDDEPIDADMREILSNMADGTFHGTDALATLYGDKGIDVAKLNLYSDTESLKQRGLKTPLHDHQLQGLLWMIKAEHRRVSKRDGESRGLWQTRLDGRGNLLYFNYASRKCKRTAPALPRGGINSDSMGLGKTIQIIATCLADRNRVPTGIKPKSGPVDSKLGSQDQPSTSALPTKRSDKDKEEDDDFDSEEDYNSECEDSDEEEEMPKKKLLKRRLASTDSSDTEEESDELLSSKEVHRPITTDGAVVKSETGSSSETHEDEDDEPVRVNGKRKTGPRESLSQDRDSKRKKFNLDGKVAKNFKAEEGEKKKSKKKEENVEKGKDELEYNETTLVVCPLSVLQNWTGQVDEHCDKKKVNYYIYHGDRAKYIRKKNTFDTILGKHTFVFTTYDTIRMEYRTIQKRREAALKRLEREEEITRREAEGDKFSMEKDGVEVQPQIQRISDSRNASEESDLKLVLSGEDEDEDSKPRIMGKGKDKGRDWYDSEDSMLESTDELDEEEYPRDTPLFKVKWRRIVLDEAHICRNPRTQLYNAICELRGERRWAVTGTPIVNSTKDLGALAAWCGLQPFAEDPKEWTRVIERPLKKSDRTEQAAGLLRKVVTSICLRRHKSMKNPQGEPIVKLPDVKFYKHTIPLTIADRDYYSKCEAACRDHLSRWADEGNLQRHQSAILTFLLRLRQMSCHRRLIGSQLLEEIQSKDWDAVDKTKTYTKTLTKVDKEELQAKLKIHVDSSEDCPICIEPLMADDKVPVITPCGHPFCKECLSNIVGRSMVNTATCPMDRLPLPSMEHMIELPTQATTPTVDEAEEVEEEDSEKTSAKVREAMKIIRATLKRDSTEKILVFSNFVKFLNIIQEEMKEAQINHARFNGGLNVQRRDAVLKKFCKPITPRQSVDVQRNIIRLEEELQRERAAEKAAEKAAADRVSAASSDGPASSEASHKSSSSSLLKSLRIVDKDIKASTFVKKKFQGKQRPQDEDIVGDYPSVLLISMGCGALGLNLTVASTVLLMDPWWQSSLEQQALDRTHRIGQKKDVKVFQIIAENTVEARMLEIQATKEGLAETAFSGMRATGSASDKRTKVETSLKDLVRLFGLSDQQTQQLTARSAAVAAATRS